MIFGIPYALLGAVMVGGLVAVYLFRSRARRRPVSSLMLWQKVARPRQGGVRRDVLVLPPLFYLELLALLAMVLAAAAPMMLQPSARTLTVIVDTSASMTAKGGDGLTSREHAARTLREESGRYARVRLILAGAGEPALAGTMTPEEARRMVAGTECVAAGDSVMRALARVSEGEGAVLVLTDRGMPEEVALRPGVVWRACGELLANAGITHASRSTLADGRDAVLVEVAGFGVAAARLRVAAGETMMVDETVTLPARRTLITPPGTQAVTVWLGDDALAIDNRVVLFPETVRPVRVAVRVAEASLRRVTERALAATGRMIADNATPQLVVTDGPADAEAACWQLVFHKPEAASWVRGPYLADRGQRVLEGVTLEGLVWAAGTNPPPGRAWVLAGSTPLLTGDASLHRAPIFRLVAGDAQGTFFQSVNWPVFVWNVVSLCAEAQPGLGSHNLRAGTAVTLRGASNSLVLETPRGSETLALRAGSTTWTPTTPGLYALRSGEAFAVNFIAPAESDLQSCRRGVWGERADMETLEQTHRSYAWTAGLAALALLMLHHARLFRRAAGGSAA